ncbi:BLUF domain-containing protein [Neisseriaceae bacterium TC5R-5]|nr:BLUF domain-containing protein [Neisseriaceae bacterium TC5R-5]
MLVRLIYCSRSLEAITNEMLVSILSSAHCNNPLKGITGLLCYGSDAFLQVLEGGRSEVNRLYLQLAQDTRHKDVMLLDYQEIQQRKFANWAMAKIPLDKMNASLLLRYSERAALNPFIMSGASAELLLDELVASGNLYHRQQA